MNVIISNKNSGIMSDLGVDVLKSISGEFTAEEIIQSFSNFFFNKMFLDITAIKDHEDVKTIQKLSIGLDVSKIILLLSDEDKVNSNFYKSKLVSMGIYNFTNDLTGLKYLYEHPNSYKDVAQYQEMNDSPILTPSNQGGAGVKVIGFKNVTLHAGATSLIYMLKKELSTRYNVKAIEVNKKDFLFFNDKDMISVTANDLGNTILRYNNVDIVLVDMNDLDERTINGDVIYLIEPSTIKLNRLILVNRKVFSDLTDKNVMLNISLLSNEDVRDFERESGCKVFYALPPMNDKVNNSNILLPFIERLGLVKRVDNSSKKSNGLFGFLRN